MTEAELSSFGEWTEALARLLAPSWTAGTELKLRLKSVKCVEQSPADFRTGMSPRGYGYAVHLRDAALNSGLFIFLPENAAAALAAIKSDKSTEDIACDLATGGALEPDDVALLQVVGCEMEALVSQLLGASLGPEVALAPLESAALDDSQWKFEGDPLPEDNIVVASVELEFGGPEPLVFEVTIGAEALQADYGLLLHFRPPEDDVHVDASVGSEHILILRDTAALQERVEGFGGTIESVTRAPGLEDFMREFTRGETSAGLVEIRGGRDYLLPLLRSLKDFPGCDHKPLLVVFDQPTTARVIQCGRLGLFAVLSHDFTESDLRRRLLEERQRVGFSRLESVQ